MAAGIFMAKLKIRKVIAECDVCGVMTELAVFDNMYYHGFSIGICADCSKKGLKKLGA